MLLHLLKSLKQRHAADAITTYICLLVVVLNDWNFLRQSLKLSWKNQRCPAQASADNAAIDYRTYLAAPR